MSSIVSTYSPIHMHPMSSRFETLLTQLGEVKWHLKAQHEAELTAFKAAGFTVPLNITSKFDMLLTELGEVNWHMKAQHEKEVTDLKGEVLRLKGDLSHANTALQPEEVNSFAHWHHKYGTPDDSLGKAFSKFENNTSAEVSCNQCGVKCSPCCRACATADQCACGNTVWAHSSFCRRCGAKRPAADDTALHLLNDQVAKLPPVDDISPETEIAIALDVVAENPVEPVVEEVRIEEAEVAPAEAPAEEACEVEHPVLATETPAEVLAEAEETVEEAEVVVIDAEAPVEVEAKEKTAADWSVDEVADWLNSTGLGNAGLGRFSGMFIEKDISGGTLLALEKADYVAMGLGLGDVKRMEKAVGALKFTLAH